MPKQKHNPSLFIANSIGQRPTSPTPRWAEQLLKQNQALIADLKRVKSEVDRLKSESNSARQKLIQSLAQNSACPLGLQELNSATDEQLRAFSAAYLNPFGFGLNALSGQKWSVVKPEALVVNTA